MKKRNRKFISFVFLLIAGLILINIALTWLCSEYAGEETYEIIRAEVVTPEEDAEEEENVVPANPQNTIDFDALKEENPDIYAWIKVPGTSVDYPIVQSKTDNSYYLSHTIDGEETTAASIFTENYNSKDFTDPHTVIYGHNMRNGSMFASLHKYEDKAFFDENREVLIYLPDKILYYTVFASYVSDNRHLMLNYDWDEKGVLEKYLEDVFAIRDMSAHIDTEMEVTGDDRIITLSTCNHGIDNERYLVQAVLTEEE